jgi:hypothetical protein
MEKQDWVSHCDEVNGLLQRIRQQAPNLLTLDEGESFEEALGANELGVAFDLLCDKFDEAGRPLSQSVHDLLMIARNKMQYAPESLKRLRVIS